MAWNWLPFRRKSIDRSAWVVRLYTRQSCSLCDDAYSLLVKFERAFGFQLQLTDIDTDPALVEQFGDKVPAVEVNGKVRCWGRIDEAWLRRLFEHGRS